MSRRLINFIASGFFISYIPVRLIPNSKFSGAGFWGTVLALLLTPVLPAGDAAFAVFIIVFLLFSVWICSRASQNYSVHDDPRIVLDEVAGYWVAIAFLPRTLGVLLPAFVCFRILDTLKPCGLKKLETLSGGIGVVLDDVASGILTNLLVRACCAGCAGLHIIS